MAETVSVTLYRCCGDIDAITVTIMVSIAKWITLWFSVNVYCVHLNDNALFLCIMDTTFHRLDNKIRYVSPFR